jgi:hypothetical protein
VAQPKIVSELDPLLLDRPMDGEARFSANGVRPLGNGAVKKTLLCRRHIVKHNTKIAAEIGPMRGPRGAEDDRL